MVINRLLEVSSFKVPKCDSTHYRVGKVHPNVMGESRAVLRFFQGENSAFWDSYYKQQNSVSGDASPERHFRAVNKRQMPTEYSFDAGNALFLLKSCSSVRPVIWGVKFQSIMLFNVRGGPVDRIIGKVPDRFRIAFDNYCCVYWNQHTDAPKRIELGYMSTFACS